MENSPEKLMEEAKVEIIQLDANQREKLAELVETAISYEAALCDPDGAPEPDNDTLETRARMSSALSNTQAVSKKYEALSKEVESFIPTAISQIIKSQHWGMIEDLKNELKKN